ncbi:drug/metabolite exporter YedA [Pseudogulbenkiania sp. MAI-1]|uniref:drug/metabolite exporter YedA n=1 Tax=Pseudogulbenkiania sp. MAI-1 TaxID=990370 RepID=UPI00045EC432|nr:drug/metabolite exporter YedA [Pseudogulbenkiania sp. MAI-1]
MSPFRLPPLTLAALAALYLIWGSTYFAIRIGVDSWPPLLMAGVRFLLAGGVLALFLLWRGEALPNWRELGSSTLLGVLMPGMGNGLVTVAQKSVSSGVAALMVATVPLFTTLCARLFGQRTRPLEWAGMALGLAGIALLNQGASLSMSPMGAILLLVACAGWALGSAWSKHLPQPGGLMASAMMMLMGGLALLAASAASGERLAAAPSFEGWLALGYLVVFGSLIAYNAYLYLLANVSPATATSYAYVNPVIAVLLGALFLGEQVGRQELGALVVIVCGVVLIGWKKDAPRPA